MSDNELVSLKLSNDLVRLNLRRPPLNFFNHELLRQFASQLDSLGDSPPCRALVIEADGAAFCAGFELAEQTKEGIFLLLEQFHRVILTLNTFSRPTIALVRGMALGAGCELAMSCDFVFAGEKASFGQPELKVGVLPSVAPLILPQLIGLKRTTEMILTGRLINAKEAESIGMIHRAATDQELEGALEELMRTFRSLSKPVLELALKSVRGIRTRELQQHLRESESLYLDELMELEDPEEGIRAFLQKRIPQWRDR